MASLYKHWEMSQMCKSLQMYMYGFLIQTYGKLQSAVSLIQRSESTIPAIKLLVFIHSARPYKNYAPKCSQYLHELVNYILLFFLPSV